MFSRVRFGLIPLMIVAIPIIQVNGGCDPQPAPICGDGLLNVIEQCDDGNRRDGDGCSSSCEPDLDETACVELTELIESEDASPYALLTSVDGHSLLGGAITTAGGSSHGWIGAFDSAGAPAWSLDLEDESFVLALIERGSGYTAIQGALADTKIIDISRTGTLEGSVALSSLAGTIGSPADILDTEAGLLLAGAHAEDLWLGRLGASGELETILHEDHAGFSDRFRALTRHGDQFAALATVGVANYSDGDASHADIQATLLITYDRHANELSRTLLSSGDDYISLIGLDLAVTHDGTWIIAGMQDHFIDLGLGTLGWVAAVRDGELLWSQTRPGSAPSKQAYPLAKFTVAGAADDVFVAGNLATVDGVRRWSMQLSAVDGELLAEKIGARSGDELPGDYQSYVAASHAVDDRVWVAGMTKNTTSVHQWLCSVAL